jgi:putative Holliday junction resolvase
MILGIDPGERRIGVAVADDSTRFARPLEVIDATEADPVARIAELVRDLNARTVVIGRPTSLSGTPGPAVAAQERLVSRLRDELSIEVLEHDERLTSVLADQGLLAGGARRETRRALRDAVAAQVMLQSYLDRRR